MQFQLLAVKLYVSSFLYHLYFRYLSVPSRAPSNVRLLNLQAHEVKVQWDPIPPNTANGKLLGYRVYYREYNYYWSSGLLQTMDTNSPDDRMLILKRLKSAQRYRIWVAAFTSKGSGSQSNGQYIITGYFTFL